MNPDGERIVVSGAGAVSPAGWGLAALHEALQSRTEYPAEPFPIAAGATARARRRGVPAPTEKLPFLRAPRLRRASPVAKFLASAATEALATAAEVRAPDPARRLAIVVASYTGSVNYSARFYGEVLADPATASPIIFPETVFNAPSSHLGALLGSAQVNHTLVGDESAFATALDLAARWLIDDAADAVLVAAGEESNPLTAAALALHSRDPIVGEGAGALLLERSAGGGVELAEVSDPINYSNRMPKPEAVARILADIEPSDAVLDPATCVEVFGDAFAATPAWALAAAFAKLSAGEATAATIPIIGKNQAAARVCLTAISNPNTSC